MKNNFTQFKKSNKSYINLVFRFFLILFSLFITQTSVAQNAMQATGGTGSYKNEIYWLNFSTVSNVAAGQSITRNFTINGIAVTVIIDNISFTGTSSNLGRLAGYIPGTWVGDGMDEVYNIGGSGGLNTLANALTCSQDGLTANFRVRAYAGLSGQPFDLGLVFASAEEDAAAGTEYSQGTTNGTVWKLLESKIQSSTSLRKITFSNSNLTAQMQMGGGPSNVALLYSTMQNTTSGNPLTTNIVLKGGGKSAVALGIIANQDYGDAPISYGAASNFFAPSITGGSNNPPTTAGDYYLSTGVGGAPNSTRVITEGNLDVPLSPRLGNTGGDNDGTYPVTPGLLANVDDNTGVDDEDAFATSPPTVNLALSTYSLNIPAFKNFTGTAYIMAWVDFNRNGTFEPEEYSTSTLTATNTTTNVAMSWNLSTIPKNAGSSFARFRISGSDPAILTDNPATSVDERSSMALASGETEDYTIALTNLSVQGIVFLDVNGMTDGSINGTGTNAGGVNAVLVNSGGNVVASTAVATNGTYSFSDIPNGTYTIRLSTTAGTVGSAAPAVSLPTNWVNTGEGTTAAGDGTPNGILSSITITNAVLVANANFGIEQKPNATTTTVSGQFNPGGTTQVNIPLTSFVSSDPDGTLTGIRITSFPTNVTSIVINGVSYTSTTFPVGGVTVPTNATGTPTQTITVDPISGAVTVDIPFVAIDNANIESTTIGHVQIPFALQTDLSVNKAVNNSTPNVGSNVVFTLIINNVGPSDATGVVVNDLLPSGYTFVSATPSVGTYVSGTGVWTVGTLNNGSNASLLITATVKATGIYANTATISGGQTDPVPGNNTSTVTPVPVPLTNLGIVKTVNNSTPNVGSNVVFTLTINNAGPSDATGVVVNDLLPSGYTFVSVTPSIGTYVSGTGVWTVGALNNGANATLAITATVKATGVYVNTATISGTQTDPVTSNNTSTITPTPVPIANLSIVKTVDNSSPNVGSNVVFTLTINNAGPSDATGVVVNDLLPSGYAFVSATPSVGSYVSGTGVWTVGVLNNGSSATLAITATVKSTGTYANTGTISGTETDPTPGNNTSTITPVPVPITNLSIVKTVDNSSPNVGSNVIFTLTINNAGPSDATGVVVNDLLPSGYTFVSATPSVGAYVSGTGVWTVGALNNGSTATLAITATVKATGTYANTATITGNQTDPVTSNNTSTSTPAPIPLTNLSVVKTVDNSSPNVGSNVVFTLTINNAGPSDATGVVVNDLLPSGYTFVSATPSAGTYVNSTGVWTVGALNNGGSATLAITATVNATGTYLNTATISGNQTDPTPGNNTSAITPVPVPIANLSIVKTVNNSTPNVGSNVIFTLTINNAGPSNATGVVVNDLLPSGYTFVSATPSVGTYASGTGVWTVGTLNNGGNATLTVTATVKSTGTYANTGTISGTQTDPIPGNNTSTITPVPVPVTNLGIIKTVNNGTPNVGSNVVFTLTINNAGPSDATGVVVNDLLPSGYTFVSATPSIGTYVSGTGVWTVGALNNGANATLAITATVKATGVYVNTATISGTQTDPVPGNNTSTVTPVPVPLTNLSVVKTVDNTAPNAGSNVVFTLTINNAGPSDATGVVVNDLLPSGYTFVSATPSVGTYTSGTGVWTVGALNNGGSATLAITATVKAVGTYTNTATISGTQTDPVPGNNTSTITPVPVPITNLSVVKTVDNSSPNVGSNVIFTLTINNAGPSDATGVVINDLLPSGYTFVSATPSVGSYASSTGIWTVGALNNGVNATLAITAIVNATGVYTNTATISGSQTDPVPGNNTSTITPVPVPITNLSVVKTVNNGTPNAGSNVVFTLTINNAGPSDATGVVVNDLLPSGYTFVSATPSVGSYASGTGVWTVGALNNGGSATLAITATVNATGTYANTATISGTQTDPVPGNNTSTVTPVPVPLANLSVVKTVDNSSPNVGSNVVFTLTINNAGPSDATGVAINDLLPSGYTFVSATPSVGAYSNGTGIWTVGALNNGGSATLAITATVKAAGTYTNTAIISGSQTDPVPGNNTSTITPLPIPITNLSVVKTVSNNTPNIGSNVVFTLMINNTGPSDATGVLINDLLPSGYTFISANTAVGTYDSGTGIWTVGTLNNGMSTTLVIIATLNATGTYANIATISGLQTDSDLTNNTSTVTPIPTPITDLSIIKSSDNNTPNVGSNVVFTMVINNAGPSDATGVLVNEILPSGYTFVSASSTAGTYDNGTGIWTIGALTNGSSETLQITATVRASGIYANTATVSGDQVDLVPGNNTSSVTPLSVPVANLNVNKTINNATPNVGSNVTFTLSVNNAGPSDATGVILNDLLPSGYTFVSATPSIGTYTSGTGVWAIGALINGANETLVLIATVNGSGVYTNTATVFGDQVDLFPTDNTSTVTPNPINVKIMKTGPATANAGSVVNYTLNVSNDGTGNAIGEIISDIVPAGLANVSWTATAQGLATVLTGAVGTGNNVTVTGDIPAGTGNQIVINITGEIPASSLVASLSNTATATATGSPIVSSNTVITVISRDVDLHIQKTGPSTIVAGNSIVYTLKVTNSGPANASNVTINDIIPSGINGVTWTATAQNGASINGASNGTGNVNLSANIPIGTAEVTVTITGVLDPSYLGTSLSNTATATPEIGVTDPTPATSTVITNATKEANVRITKSGPANIGAGEMITYTIRVVNDGPSNVTGVEIKDIIPTQIISPTWSATVQNGATVSALSGAGNINITGDIPASVGVIEIVITGIVNPAVVDGSSFSNTATADLPVGSPVTDPDLTSNTSTVPTVVNNTPTLRVSKSGPSIVNIGDPIEYTIVITNGGLGDITNATIVDNVPNSVIVSNWNIVVDGGATVTGNISGTTNTITSSGGNIPADGNPLTAITLHVQGVVGTNAAAVFTNTVVVSSNGDMESSVTTAVNQSTDIIIEKNGPQTATAGLPISYTIKVSNSGPRSAQDLVINDVIPSDIQNINWSAASFGTATITGNTNGTTSNVMTTADIDVGSANYILITIDGTINPATTATTISNTATVALPITLIDFNTANNQSTINTIINKETNLSITKAVNNPTPNVGTNIAFTLTVNNAGPSAATGVEINEALPLGYTFISAVPSVGTYNDGTGLWTIGALANGAGGTLVINVSVNATGPYANTVSITGNETDPVPGNNTATVIPIPTPITDLSIVKIVDNATPNVGSNVAFTLTINNTGPSDATGVVVNDLLQSGYTFVSAVPSVGTYDNATGVWTVGVLANGANATLNITASVNAIGLYANTATITGSQTDLITTNNTSTVTPVPVPITNLSVVKTVDNPTPNVGDTIVFTLTINNAGPSDATGVVVNDLLLAGYTFVSADPLLGTYNNATGVWTVGTLTNGVTTTLAITVKVKATGSYVNTATIGGNETDPALGDNTSTITPVPVPITNLSITKGVDNLTPNVGSNVVFTLTVNNAGPSAATNVVVTDSLPTGYTFVSAIPSVGSYDNSTGIWTVGGLTNGGNVTLTITATVNAVGIYVNTANVAGAEIDPVPADNTATVTPVPTPITDLSIVKTVNNSTPNVGTNVIFTLAVNNVGPSAATNVIVTEMLPSGYTFVSANPFSGSYNDTSGIWNIGTLNNGVGTTLEITATVNAVGNYSNTVTITGTETDPVPGNNTSTSVPIPTPITDLSIVKTVDNATPNVGSEVVFTLTINNAGPSAATNVIVTEMLPSGYTYVSANPSAGTYDNGTGIWTLGALNNGITATLNITASVNAIGLYANTATITGAETDPTPGNNTSTSTPVPVPITNLNIAKTVDNITPDVGSDIVFTVTVNNSGPSAATNVVVTDLLPSGYTFGTAVPSVGTYDNVTGIWTIGGLANGANAILDITVNVNATGDYVNNANVTGNELDPILTDNTATSTPVPIPVIDLNIVKTVDNATPNVGSNVVFTITVNNVGPSDATGVLAADPLPTGYTFVSATTSTGVFDNSTAYWTIGGLNMGASATLNITATVNATGEYDNIAATVGDQEEPNYLDNITVSTPVPVPITNLSIVKTVDNATPNVGGEVVFTLTINNAGPSDATDVVVTDLLPSGYTFVSATPSAGTYDNASGLWTVGVLNNGISATLNVTALVNASGNYSNTASISGTEIDPIPGDNTSISTPVPVPITNLNIAKTANNVTPNVGDTIVFTVTVNNAGPSDATNVVVTDTLPSGYTFISATPSIGTYDNSTGIWTIGGLVNGVNASLDIVVSVNATGDYANTASVTGSEVDPILTDNTATSTPIPTPIIDLNIAKTVDNPTPNVGSNVVFTITINNAGPSDATGVIVFDPLPSGYTFISATPSVGTYDDTIGVWTIGGLNMGGNATMSVTALVNATGDYDNIAITAGDQDEPVYIDNIAISTPIPVPVANLSVVKTVDNATPDVGSDVVFTITINNAGPSDATGVEITEMIPSGYAFISAIPSIGTYDNTSGLWTVGGLSNGISATLAITVKVNATGNYANTVTISGVEMDPVPGDNTSTVTPIPVPITNLSITKTGNNATPNVGGIIIFTLTINNTGPSDATGVEITDVLPSGYTFVSATPSVGTYDNTNGLWTVGGLNNGVTATLEITASVNANGDYVNTATIIGVETDPIPGDNTSTFTPIPVPVTNLSIVKTVDNVTPNVGSTIVFTLTINNAGPSDATAVIVNDLIPSGYTYVSSIPSTGTYDNTNGQWVIGGLTNGATATLDITVTVNASGDYVNTATITGTETDPTPGDNTSTSTPVPVPVANLSIVKTVDNVTPNVGNNVTFTLTVNNAGPSDATNVMVTDLLPSGYTFVSAMSTVGTFDTVTGIWTLGALSEGATATVNIIATVNATGIYANTATITGDEMDPVPGDNTSTITPIPIAITDLNIVKTVDNATPDVGSTVTFTLTVNNAGPSDATGIVVTDVLPAGYTFISAIPSIGTYNNTNGIWSIGGLNNGVGATLDITVSVNASGMYTNTATITGDQNDPNLGNNTSTSTPVPVPVTNLSIVKTIDNATPNVGGTTIFTLTVNNAGPSDATGVEVTDILPSGYTFVSAIPSAGMYDSTSGLWTVGVLNNGANATLAITVTVNTIGDYANTATVGGSENDPTPGDNTSTVTPIPVPITNLSIVKTVDFLTPYVGTDVIFTLTVNNAGPSNATGVEVTDVLPSGYTFVSATPSIGTYDNTSGLWTVGTLNNGVSATLAITATVNAAGVYANTATITGDQIDPTPDDNTSTVTPDPVPVANLSVIKTADNLAPNVGSNVVFTIIVNNSGPSNATNVAVLDTLPTGYTFVSATPSVGTYSNTNGIWIIGGLNNGSNATLTVVATVNVSGDYTNTAIVIEGETYSTPDDNTSTVTPVPVPITDLSIVKTVDNATPDVGSTVVFTLAVNNAGPSDATGVEVTDIIPSGYTFVSAVPSIGTYDNTSGLWTIGGLNNGASANLVITATVNPTGNFANTAITTGDQLDPTPNNNTSTSTPIPALIADLSVLKTINTNTPTVGSNVVFTITVNNAGPNDATGVVVTDVLPSGYTFVSSAPSVGVYNNVTGLWTIGALVNGGIATIDITAIVNAAGSYANTASVNGGEKDPTPNNNTSTSTPIPVNVIIANPDTAGPINGASGGMNVVNVLTNDLLNGNPIDPSTVTITPVIDGPLSVNSDGTVDVLPNTPAGVYTITYQVCEIANPANCSTTIVTVTVIESIIIANDDDFSAVPTNGGTGGTIGNAFGNDTLNGAVVTAGTVIVTITNDDGLNGIVIDQDGNIQVPGGSAVGIYHVEYQICDKINPDNCATAIITIVIKDPCDFDNSPVDCDVVIYNGITPDGDGQNDTFFIKGIERYPDNTLEIYNRWGVLVFSAEKYDNVTRPFRGLSEGRTTINQPKELPTGTYYYVLKYRKTNGTGKEKAGYLYIN
ncbi:gliding motility-associated C-terminal domain-containing protein [Flavobacterium sp. '19STA2R22 D10 B1']|uniref:T9SS type B sorting domain-containing protein n=1 Tax=Flavobacterium aerium TaxID=3037261 RepID=UPI00278BDA18|nr:gliding motility-associated C-terminal domain-containing protein [Flavobacterium sp. '19STA2R22 D10 B1']